MAPLDDNFLANTLHAFVTRISGEWSQFLNLQIRAIEDTKVKIHKRKGVIPFMKTFRLFSAHIEDILTPASEVSTEVRIMVDQAYDRITKAMFESLRVIAKESPSTAPHGGAGDPEDKEALNYHILLIENMNYYVEHVEEHSGGVLAEGKRVANDDLDEHLSLYVDAVIRRPLGKIMVCTNRPLASNSHHILKPTTRISPNPSIMPLKDSAAAPPSPTWHPSRLSRYRASRNFLPPTMPKSYDAARTLFGSVSRSTLATRTTRKPAGSSSRRSSRTARTAMPKKSSVYRRFPRQCMGMISSRFPSPGMTSTASSRNEDRDV
jgi:hypothetical protein